MPAASGDVRFLSGSETAFLSGLLAPPARQSIDSFPPDDRSFIVGIQRRLRMRELELPVLPEMSMQLSRMFRAGAPAAEFVKVIEGDASLAVEVLKTANSAFYAASGRSIASLQDAIVRIGLDRLQSVLMVAHLRGKVLKTGPFQAEADLLLELAIPVGALAGKLARGRRDAPDICFMRGALLHVEHLVILGATAAIARDAKRTITPSQAALHYAFFKCGRQIRDALAAMWNLRQLLVGGDEETGVVEEYELIRDVLVSQWLRLPLPEAAARFEGLEAALADIHPRVRPPAVQAATGTDGR
jgi:hypothetical protein